MGVNGIYGLSGSGLDIESLVKMGMSSKNKQYDKMEQQEIANTWLKEAYNGVYNDLTTYKYGTLSTYKMQSNMNAMQATSSNSSVVTATANGAAAAMNHVVTVDSVASNAYLLTTQDSSGNNLGVTRANTSASASNNLADVLFKSYSVATATEDGSNWNFTYNITRADGTTDTVNGSDVAISLKIKDTAGSDTEYTLSYTYDELFTGYKSGEYTGYTGDGSAVFSGGKTLNDFASAFAKTGANIQGGYDTANDTFSLYNKTSGKSNIIDITVENDNTATLFNHLNLGTYNASTGVLSDRISFATPTAMKTTMESVDLTTSITNSSQSVSMKDVLGLTATSVDNGDGSYTITVKDHSGSELGTFTKNADGTYTGADETAFSMNLSNGTDSATVSFTLGELFNLDDIGSKSSLGGNAGLDELASKINATGLGITAAYDAIKDSFSLSNPSGQANLTADGTGTNQGVAQQMIDSLNLATSPSLTYLTVDNSSNLADVFGLHTNMYHPLGDGTFQLKVLTNGSEVQVGATQTGSNPDFTQTAGQAVKKAESLFTFELSDGDNSATITLNYGDLVDYSALGYNNGNNIRVTKQDGSTATVGPYETVTVRNPTNSLSVLADKINAAGLNIEASYANGTFSLLNPNGNITITNADGSVVDVSGKLNLSAADPSTMAYKTSTGITRVNQYSTDDTLAAAVGFTAVKNTDGSLTVKKSDGSSETVAATDTALSFKVSDGSNETEVALTYADLFDTSGSGTLKGSGDFSTLVDKINTAATSAGVSVTAAYDSSTGKFSLTNNAGDATLTGVDSLASALVSKMGFAESEETKQAKEEAGQAHQWAGTNASVTIDGKTYDNDTNKLTVAGVTYTFLDTTAAGSKATISVSQDTDKIVDYVKNFVEDYNKLLDSLNEKLSEKKYSDYKPLSKRQEEEMTEKQIEKWTEKAKSGLLYHNSEIQSLVSAMREAIYTKVDAVDSEYNTLSSIGITTTNTKGHLTLDTDKLKKALAADPDCVYQLFASDQDSTYIAGTTNKNKITSAQSKLDYANTGVANRLYNVMTNHMSKISDIAGTSKDTDDQSYLGKLITNMQTKMSSFKTLMTSYENKLYKRYDAMEVALSKLNMQLGYISGSFS
ncbi:Flagellar capping protein FliD [Anaerovibrio lipolyticus DSM 3074]|uniref:Filament cap protein n=1 Tax=Anaerovibrio lipolyticus DSM 3074 TaxID=1120997 RepID=A0A1M6EEB6_9FIRM|nr:flagellar filament capping protein FliD [Anaerovibrio lipolyticus]SHI83832.1 Flagellar capping protein FliD [Anaerovibrio lipolyticus DSM 3074]